MPIKMYHPVSFSKLVTAILTFCVPLFICDQICPTASGQSDSINLIEVRAEMIRIAESSNKSGVDTSRIAREFVTYYNSVAAQYPSEMMDLVEIAGEVAGAYHIGYTIKNNVMQLAYFSDKSEEYIRLDPETPNKSEPGEVFKVVERLPRFPGCEDISGSDAVKSACSKEKLLNFIDSNLRYPEQAKAQGLEGTVVVYFMVGIDGSLSQISVASEIGHGFDEEALRLVELMNHMDLKWVPGTQRGKPVEAPFTVPVSFEL